MTGQLDDLTLRKDTAHPCEELVGYVHRRRAHPVGILQSQALALRELAPRRQPDERVELPAQIGLPAAGAPPTFTRISRRVPS